MRHNPIRRLPTHQEPAPIVKRPTKQCYADMAPPSRRRGHLTQQGAARPHLDRRAHTPALCSCASARVTHAAVDGRRGRSRAPAEQGSRPRCALRFGGSVRRSAGWSRSAPPATRRRGRGSSSIAITRTSRLLSAVLGRAAGERGAPPLRRGERTGGLPPYDVPSVPRRSPDDSRSVPECPATWGRGWPPLSSAVRGDSEVCPAMTATGRRTVAMGGAGFEPA